MAVRRSCYFYEMPVMAVQDDIAYVERRLLLRVVERTYSKLAMSVRAYRDGQRLHFRHMHDCCYCEE